MLKKMWALFIAVSLVLPIVSVAEEGAPGVPQPGYQQTPYIITNAEEFAAFKERAASGTRLYYFFKIEGNFTPDYTFSGGKFISINFMDYVYPSWQLVERVQFLHVETRESEPNETSPLPYIYVYAPKGYTFDGANTIYKYFVDEQLPVGPTNKLNEGENQIVVDPIAPPNPQIITSAEQFQTFKMSSFNKGGVHWFKVEGDLTLNRTYTYGEFYAINFITADEELVDRIEFLHIFFQESSPDVGLSLYNITLFAPEGYAFDGTNTSRAFSVQNLYGFVELVAGENEVEVERMVTPTPTTGGSSGGGGSAPKVTPTATPGSGGNISPIEPPEPPVSEGFADASGHWSEDYINELVSRGVINGYDNGDGTFVFLPENDVTRAEFVKMLAGIAEVDTSVYVEEIFSDVFDDYWASTYIAWASSSGYIGGYEDGEFRPENKITREEIAVVMSRFLQLSPDLSEPPPGELGWKDEGEISAWAYDAMQIMKYKQYINGDDLNYVNPKYAATRAETAKILCQALSGESN
ncbi:MAG: S-layer homology domain-containing protein [Clostridiales bacterium]|jgi:hypothetical protein|nr:S-layer homology domain-containing protein [Clostridiales bacterium]